MNANAQKTYGGHRRTRSHGYSNLSDIINLPPSPGIVFSISKIYGIVMFWVKKLQESKGSKLSNRFSNERSSFVKIFLKFHYFLLFKKTSQQFIRKTIRKFDPSDFFDFFDSKYNYAELYFI